MALWKPGCKTLNLSRVIYLFYSSRVLTTSCDESSKGQKLQPCPGIGVEDSGPGWAGRKRKCSGPMLAAQLGTGQVLPGALDSATLGKHAK